MVFTEYLSLSSHAGGDAGGIYQSSGSNGKRNTFLTIISGCLVNTGNFDPQTASVGEHFNYSPNILKYRSTFEMGNHHSALLIGNLNCQSIFRMSDQHSGSMASNRALADQNRAVPD
jgi:hypothetical protein